MSGNSFTNCKPKTSFHKYFTTLNKCFRNIFEQRTISTCLSPPELLTLEKMSGRPPTCKQKYGVLLSQSKEWERGSKHGGCESGGEKVGVGGITSSPPIRKPWNNRTWPCNLQIVDKGKTKDRISACLCGAIFLPGGFKIRNTNTPRQGKESYRPASAGANRFAGISLWTLHRHAAGCWQRRGRDFWLIRNSLLCSRKQRHGNGRVNGYG